MMEFENITQKIYRAYIEKEDFGIFRDLIIEIMKKGYYPMIYSKPIESLTMDKIDETRFKFSFPESRLKLLNDEELRELGYTPVEYTLRIIENLQSFDKTAREEQ